MKPSSATLLLSSFVIPSAAYAVAWTVSPRFRNWVRDADPSKLTLLQTFRLVGTAMFGYETVRGKIPGRYGFTTALSDFSVGATAPIAACRLSGERLKWWHWAGMAGLIVSGGSGILTSPTRAGVLARWKTSQPTDSFPLVLVPLVFGPGVLIAHLMAISNLSQKDAAQRPVTAGEPVTAA